MLQIPKTQLSLVSKGLKATYLVIVSVNLFVNLADTFLNSFTLSDLKRFSDSNSRSSKLSTFVNFPLKELDLREFSADHSGNDLTSAGSPEWKRLRCWLMFLFGLPAELPVYNLYAVSNHIGNTLGGHYTAYCKNPALGEWYSYNDSRYQISHYWITLCVLLSDGQQLVYAGLCLPAVKGKVLRVTLLTFQYLRVFCVFLIMVPCLYLYPYLF